MLTNIAHLRQMWFLIDKSWFSSPLSIIHSIDLHSPKWLPIHPRGSLAVALCAAAATGKECAA